MWKCLTKHLGRHSIRTFSTSKQSNTKVAVIGAAGGIGQPLSLLLKMNPLIKELGLFDLKHTPGIAVDLSHIDTDAVVKGFCGSENMKFALHCSEIVVCVAGMPRKPGMKREDLFKSNASIACEVVKNIAKYCPKALIAMVTNPINSIIPLAAEILKKANVYDPNKLFGVTTLDVVRAHTFIAQFASLEPHKIKIPVIGGHSAFTILPVFSNLEPQIRELDEEDVEELTEKIREGGNVVVQAKDGSGSATLSMAYSAAHFVNSLAMGLAGMGNTPVECSFVQSKAHNEVDFFASPLKLGKDGIDENLGIPRINDYEQQLLECLIPQLKKDIEMGLEFAKTIK